MVDSLDKDKQMQNKKELIRLAHGTRSSMDVDTNAGRGEQVNDHYLSGAVVTNYGRKNYRKHYIKLQKI